VYMYSGTATVTIDVEREREREREEEVREGLRDHRRINISLLNPSTNTYKD